MKDKEAQEILEQLQTCLLFPSVWQPLSMHHLRLGDTMLALATGVQALAERSAPLPDADHLQKVLMAPPALRALPQKTRKKRVAKDAVD